MENKKNKHMNPEDRIEIQECLAKGMRFKAIARRIGKDATTVSNSRFSFFMQFTRTLLS